MDDPRANGKSRIVEPRADGTGAPIIGEFIISMARAADGMLQWGHDPHSRDLQLRSFWPTEPVLASAMGSTIEKYAAFGATLEGPPRTVGIMQDILHNSDRGAGWESLQIKVATDLFSQDNGAFVEIVRQERGSPTSPCVQLNHLDAGRCFRTGNALYPVLYRDIEGNTHRLAWYEVLAFAEMPTPIETFRGMQYCAVTRVLRGAQIMRDIGIFTQGKISGRNPNAIHLVGGITGKAIEDRLQMQRTQAMAADPLGLHIVPLIVGALDPTAKVSKETLDFASVPDHFDFEEQMRWYINTLALAFGQDFQDFAPLPGGNLGSSQQSGILHMKARAKGPKLYMSMWERGLNFHGVMPRTVHFSFGDQDIAEDQSKAELRSLRAATRAARIQSGEITPQVAREIARDEGDLADEMIDILEEQDAEKERVVRENAQLAGQALQEAQANPVAGRSDPTPHKTVSLSGRLGGQKTGDVRVGLSRNMAQSTSQGRTGAR